MISAEMLESRKSSLRKEDPPLHTLLSEVERMQGNGRLVGQILYLMEVTEIPWRPESLKALCQYITTLHVRAAPSVTLTDGGNFRAAWRKNGVQIAIEFSKVDTECWIIKIPIKEHS
ncbi:MAG: hypothetical protein M0Z85_04460 [Gammaproteobacteria bacterium]|nr:hypothetical protein [Gammaproteobacteria bacterium]